MSNLLRQAWEIFTGGPAITISGSEALSAATAHCASRGWPWLEPVSITRTRGKLRFWTNSGTRGGNVYVVVDGQSGAILQSGMTPK